MRLAAEYLDTLPFSPDSFQIEAATAIDAGESVVVTAPTGAGKTVVAEAAIVAALGRGGRAFYTTPIKALSNQKFSDLRASYGDEAVGLLTGDNSINGAAPVVVMTTEVLRNMIYAESPDLADLDVVILDEVHYLADRSRGGVWEEVIIHLPRRVRLVCLSATVANPSNFADWVESRRGPTRLVVETHRPVPLETWYMAADSSSPGGLLYEPMFLSGRPNGRLEKLLRPSASRRRRFSPPRRLKVVEQLAEIDRLPAIYFVFSRVGCESAATQVASKVSLTTTEEAERITRIATVRTRHLSVRDLGVLGFDAFLERLTKGITAHHAGMVPAFKEAVEEVFVEGLAKVVFATETLALGINMPARTVVIESLSKFDGEGHELLQPGDFTQLTGRAGRRGIDSDGTAVVLHSSFVPFARMTGIAAAGTHPLRSSFRPTYNMTVNLIATYDRATAEELLQASFGQFEGQRERSQLKERAAELLEELKASDADATCHLGDVAPYVNSGAAAPLSSMMRRFAQELVPGDVIEGQGQRWVVLAKGTGSNPRLLVITGSGKAERLRPAALPPSAVRLGAVVLPEPFAPRDSAYRDKVAETLRHWEPAAGPDLLVAAATENTDPVLGCPDLGVHIEATRRSRRLRRDISRLSGRLNKPTGDLVRSFQALLGLLDERGYVDGWSLTPKGEQLRFVYNELDLRIVQAMEERLFFGLDHAELAAFASMFVYEPRLRDYQRPVPTAKLAGRFEELLKIDHELSAAEDAAGIAPPRPPADGFAAVVYEWAQGEDLEVILREDEAAGDLVRNSRQVMDLLRQLGDAFDPLQPVVGKAIRSLDRGVVAAGGIE